jgi:phospholipase C
MRRRLLHGKREWKFAREDTGIVPDRTWSRREFLHRGAAAAAGLFVSSCTSRTNGTLAPVRPTFATRDVVDIDTRWPIKRVVYVMLENRSYDNLFGRFPGTNGATTGVKFGQEVALTRTPEWLPGDLPHDRAAALNSLAGGEMDGFALGAFGPLYAYSQFEERDVPAYWHWAREYVLSDNFFASALGPSYPNHLFYIAGQAGGAIDNPENIAQRQVGKNRWVKSWGCDAYGESVFVFVEDEYGNLTKHDTCFEFETVGEQLTREDVDWAYYSAEPHQAGYIWQAYSAIKNVYGTELFDEHVWPVDDLFRDIHSAALPSVTWITPRFQLSDHPPFSTRHAHNWVVKLVNGIMRSEMWEHTAIFITWDEWGGLYDHVPPPKDGRRELGFRVPMLVISPYARRGYVDDALGEFTSPLKFVADNWGLEYLTDAIGKTHNFEHVFDFRRGPRKPSFGRTVRATGDPFEFPTDFPEWPEGISPYPPQIKS